MDKPREKVRETIGESFLRREPWTCDDCLSEFELGAVVVASDGFLCPKCGSKHIGPKRDQAAH